MQEEAPYPLPARWEMAGQQPPFVGHRHELGVLEDAWAEVLAGANGALFIGGEPGAGKSRLVIEAARALHGQGATVLLGSCVAELSAPYEPFDQLLQPLLPAIRQGGIPLEGGGPGGYRRRLGLLAAVVGNTDLPPGAPESANHRRVLYDAVAAALRGAATRAPMVLVMEDLHWAGATAAELLGYLIQRTTQARILILATHRSYGPERSGPLGAVIAGLRHLDGVRRLDLEPLTADDVAQYLARQVREPGHHLGRAAAVLHAQSGGNPFFLRELWREISMQGGLASLGRGSFGAPQSVRDALEDRLRRITAGQRATIELAAVIGEEFDCAELIAVTQRPAQAVLADLDAGADLAIVEQAAGTDGRFRFPHAVARQVLLDGQSPSRLTRAHGRIAEELERSFPAADRRVQRLAHHYASARALGYTKQAVRYLAESAELAHRSLAHADAASLFERAAAIAALPAERDELRLQAVKGFVLAADFSRARELSEQVIGAGSARQRLQAATLYETASFRPGREGGRAVDVLTGALRAVPRDPADELYIRGIGGLGRAVAFTGASAQAQALGDDAIAMARALGDENLLADTLETTLFHSHRPAYHTARLARADELTRLALRSGNAEHLGAAACSRALACYARGDADGLDGCEADLSKTARDTGGEFWRYFAECIRYARQLAQGDLSAASLTCSRLGRPDDPAGPDDAEGPYGTQMFLVQRESGRLERIRPLITGQEAPGQQWAPGLLALYTELRMQEPAGRLLRWLLDQYRDHDRDSGDWPIRLTFMVMAATWLGDTAAAARLRPLMAEYTGLNLIGGHFVAVFGSADRYLGRLDSLLGNGAPEDYFERALDLDRRTRAPLHEAETLAAYAAHLRSAGKDAAKGQQLAEQAMSIARPRDLRRVISMLPSGQHNDRRGTGRPGGLTRREIDVLRLLGAGASNREIAARLVIAENTAANHVRNIMTKIGAGNRTQAALYAAAHGLLGGPEQADA